MDLLYQPKHFHSKFIMLFSLAGEINLLRYKGLHTGVNKQRSTRKTVQRDLLPSRCNLENHGGLASTASGGRRSVD